MAVKDKPARVAVGGFNEPPVVVKEAELATIGSMLVEREATRAAIDRLKAEDFYREDHQRMFAAAAHVYERDGVVDVVTLAEELRKRNHLVDLNEQNVDNAGARYILYAINAVTSASHVDYYARLVQEASLDRQITVQLYRTAEEKTPEKLKKLNDLMNALYGVRHDRIFDMRKHLPAALDEIFSKKPTILDTGFDELDRIVGGIDVGDVTTVGARPGGGKTAFMTKLALQMAEKFKTEVLYVTTEMTEDQMVTRILPMATSIPAFKYRKRILTQQEMMRTHDACAERLSKLPFQIFTKSRTALADIRHAAAQSKARVIFIDYLQRCIFPEGDMRAYQIMDFYMDLKTLAHDNGLNIVIGCQLDRKIDRNISTEPFLSDLKDSGAIESESDQVLLLWTPTEKELNKEIGYEKPPAGQKLIRIKAAKNRHNGAGECADFYLNGALVEICEKFSKPYDNQITMDLTKENHS